MTRALDTNAPTPNPSPGGEREIIAPPLQGRGWGGAEPAHAPLTGRGKSWGVPKAKVEVLHTNARGMRNTPTEPEARLWAKLSRSQLGGHKFRRQATIGSFIADFLCPSSRLIVEIDGHTHDPARDASRDAALVAHGYQVLRFSNGDVMRNLDGVLLAISAALSDLPGRHVSRPHPNPSPEGEGLYEVFTNA